MRLFVILLCFTVKFAFSPASAQDCPVKNRVGPDGSMYYYIDPLLVYRTSEDSLFGGVVTDKENYYLSLAPFPFPQKSKEIKLSKKNLDIFFADNKRLELEYFDSRYTENDSVLLRLYFIKKNQLDDFRNHEIESVQMELIPNGSAHTYDFKLHKNAVKEQLACFFGQRKNYWNQ